MRETVKDKGRLEHISQSINVLLENKDKYTLEQIIPQLKPSIEKYLSELQ